MPIVERILNKTTPCNCGCNGSDPWHKRYYQRAVAKTTEIEGTVKLPFSTQPVRVTRDVLGTTTSGRTVYGTWTVDRDSIVFDKY